MVIFWVLKTRYFIEQKKEEITTFGKIVLFYLAVATPIVVIPYLFGHYSTDRMSTFCGTQSGAVELCGPIGQWFLGVGYILIPLLLT